MKINKFGLFLGLIFSVVALTTAAFAQDEQYQVSVKRFQNARSRQFKTAGESPLKKKYLGDFNSLAYFDVNQAYRVTAKYTPATDNAPFDMPTFYGNKNVKHLKRGTLTFSLNGKEYTLGVYQRVPQLDSNEKITTRSYAFVPFRDLTNGNDSYQGGRYIDLAKTIPETITLDFNLAYTPDCAYDKRFICPVPPDENRLDNRIEAGEKVYAPALDAKTKK